MSSMRQKKPRPGMKASSLAHGRPPQPPRVVVDLWGTAPSPVPNDMPRAGHQRSRQKPTVDDKISQSSSELPAGIMPQIGWGLGPDRNRATTDSATSFNAVGFVPKRDVSSNSNGASPSSISEPNGTKVGESADTSGEDADDNTEAPSMIDPFDDGISAMHEPHSSSATTASADHSFSVFPTEGGVWDQPVLSSQSLATGAGESGEDMSRLTSASWNATFSQPQYSPALGGGLQQQTSMPMKMAPSPRPPPVLADESGWCVAEILAQARPGTRTSSECNEVASLIRASPGSSLAAFSTVQLAQLAQHLLLRHVSASAAASDSHVNAGGAETGGVSMPPSNHQHYPVALFQEGDAAVGFCMFLVPTAADSRSWWGDLSDDTGDSSNSTVELFRRSVLLPDDPSSREGASAVAPTATRVVLRGTIPDNEKEGSSGISEDTQAGKTPSNVLRVMDFDYDRPLKPTASHYYQSSEGGLKPWWAIDQVDESSELGTEVGKTTAAGLVDSKAPPIDRNQGNSHHGQGSTKQEKLLAPVRTVGPFQTFGEDALEPMESVSLRNQDDSNSSIRKSLHVHSFTAALHAPALIAVLPLEAYCQIKDVEQEEAVENQGTPPLNIDWLRGPHYRYMAEQRCISLMESMFPFTALADPARRWLASQAQERQLPSGTAATAPGRTVRLVWLLDHGAYLATSTPAAHTKAIAAAKVAAVAQGKKNSQSTDAKSSPSEVLLGKLPGISLVASGRNNYSNSNSVRAATAEDPHVWALSESGDLTALSSLPDANYPPPIGERLRVLGGMELLEGEDSYDFGCVAVSIDRGTATVSGEGSNSGSSVSNPKTSLPKVDEKHGLRAFVVRRSAFEKAFLYGGGMARGSVIDRDGAGGRVKWQRPVGAAATKSPASSMPLKQPAISGPSAAMSPSSLLRRKNPDSGSAVVNEVDNASMVTSVMSTFPIGSQRAFPLQGGAVVTLDEYFSSPSAPFLPQLAWEQNDDGEDDEVGAEAPVSGSSMLPYLVGGQRLSQSSSSSFRKEKLPYALPTKAYSAASVNPLSLRAPSSNASSVAPARARPPQVANNDHLSDTTARLLRSMTAQPEGTLPRVVDHLATRKISQQQRQRDDHHKTAVAATPMDTTKPLVLNASGSVKSAGGGSGSAPVRATRRRDRASSARIAHLSKHLCSLNFDE